MVGLGLRVLFSVSLLFWRYKNFSPFVDNWDEEKSTTTEDWDSEWTGSLDKTTVFGPSTSTGPESTAAPESSAPDPNEAPPPSHAISPISAVLDTQVSTGAGAAAVSLAQQQQPTPPSPLSESVLSMGAGASYATVVPSQPAAASSSISPAQTIDLAALLQKAAPHSTLGRLPAAQMVDGAGAGAGLIPSASLGIEAKSAGGNLLGEGLKSPAGMLSSNGSASAVPSSAPPPQPQQSYSPSSSAISNSIFSNSGELKPIEFALVYRRRIFLFC